MKKAFAYDARYFGIGLALGSGFGVNARQSSRVNLWGFAIGEGIELCLCFDLCWGFAIGEEIDTGKGIDLCFGPE